MKVIRTKIIRNCSQSNNQIDLFFDCKITQDFLNYLSNPGRLEIFENFEKPFFRLYYINKYLLKGALGNTKLRLYLPESNCDEILEKIISLIESFHN